jgi:putative transcriptional regulator
VELLNLRQKLNVSQSVFAQYLRTNKRTLENWEQGRANPNAQAAALIKMVAMYPDTIERLGMV